MILAFTPSDAITTPMLSASYDSSAATLRASVRAFAARALTLILTSLVLAHETAAQAVGIRYRVGEPSALRLESGPDASIAAESASQANGAQPVPLDTPDRVKRSPWWAPVASAVVPGSGQIALSQQRSVAYAVAEAYMLVQAFVAQRDADRLRSQYQTLAADVARAQFGGSRPIGPWVTYYEPMEKYLESGAYSVVRGSTVVPETDESTYNGARWLLARQTFWRDPAIAPPTSSPEYARALAAYVKDAVTDEYRWSWRDAQLQWDVYRQIIVSKNRSYQRANNYIGLIVANHLVSMVDAYVSVRIRRFGGAGLAGLRLDGVNSEIGTVGDPASGIRRLQTTIRIVPTGR